LSEILIIAALVIVSSEIPGKKYQNPEKWNFAQTDFSGMRLISRKSWKPTIG
jgi:hypothetical protein